MKPPIRPRLLALAAVAAAGLCGLACTSAPKPAAAPTPTPAVAGSAPVDVSGLKPFATLSAAAAGTAAPNLAQPLTSAGECSDPSFAPDGERVLFVSRARAAHRNAQVYELALKARLEKRVSFHDGDDSNPSYRPDGARVLYASTTDEIKEDAQIVRALRARFSTGAAASLPLPPSELYLASFDGAEIRRLTSSEGFDAEARFDGKGQRIVFASSRATGASRTQIFMMGTDGGARRLAPGFDDDGSPVFSPDGKSVAFVRRAPDSAVAHLFALELKPGAKPVQLTARPALNVSPAWHPNGREIVFASDRADGKTFDIYSVSLPQGTDGPCVRRVTDAAGDETQPALSRDGARLLFAGDQSGRRQIYVAPYAPAAECAPESAARP